MSSRADVDGAIELITRYGQIDGAHHKAWVIDQVLRKLLGSNDAYEAFVYDYQYRNDNGDEELEPIYDWDEGIAP